MNPIRMAKIESGLRVVLQFVEAFNAHDLSKMAQILSSDCMFDECGPGPEGTVYKGISEISQYFVGVFQQSPNIHLIVEDLIGLGFRSVLRYRYERIIFLGKEEHFRGMDLFQLRDALICERLSYRKS